MILLSIAFAASLATTNEQIATKADILNEMTQRLLDGESVPRNIETRLMVLEPAERFEVVVFLRRSGLLVGKSLSVDRLLGAREEMETGR